MDTLLFVDVLRAVGLGVFGLTPIFFATLGAIEEKHSPNEQPQFFIRFLALVVQIGFAISIYIAGAKS